MNVCESRFRSGSCLSNCQTSHCHQDRKKSPHFDDNIKAQCLGEVGRIGGIEGEDYQRGATKKKEMTRWGGVKTLDGMSFYTCLHRTFGGNPWQRESTYLVLSIAHHCQPKTGLASVRDGLGGHGMPMYLE